MYERGPRESSPERNGIRPTMSHHQMVDFNWSRGSLEEGLGHEDDVECLKTYVSGVNKVQWITLYAIN